MMEVVKQVGILHPCTVEVYVAVDGPEVCLSLTPPKVFCAQDDSMREVKLELAFSRYETHEDKIKRGVQTKGPTSIRHGGEGVREVALALLGVYVLCGPGAQDS